MEGRCPITLRAAHELEMPVAFASSPDQPYELEALCTWLERNPTNPLTGQTASAEELMPLGDSEQQKRGAEALSERSLTLAFRMELEELKRDLKQLNARIEQTNKTMHTLMAEKTRIELRVQYIDNRYKKCPCVIS